MKLSAKTITLAFVALSFAACDSDSAAEVACKKAHSCGLLESDQTVDECVKEVQDEATPEQLEKCADCLDDHSCSEIDDDVCEEACED